MRSGELDGRKGCRTMGLGLNAGWGRTTINEDGTPATWPLTEANHGRQGLQRALPVHRQLGAQHHGRIAINRWGQGGSGASPPAATPRATCIRWPSAAERLNYRTDGLRSKDWEEFAEGRRAEARLRLHALRSGRGRALSRLAGPADDGALGRRGPRRVRRLRGADLQVLPQHLWPARQPHQDLREPADPLARQAQAATAHRRDRSSRPTGPLL